MSDAKAGDLDQSPPDDAVAAFEAMREELALLRFAVQGFAGRQEEIAARDYTPDLARLLAAQNKVHEAVNGLAHRPGVALTPEDMAQQMETAAVTARRADREALHEAEKAQRDAAQSLDAMIGRIRTERAQRDALIWAAVLGMIVALCMTIFAQYLAWP